MILMIVYKSWGECVQESLEYENRKLLLLFCLGLDQQGGSGDREKMNYRDIM